ncbi:TetR/AcrR family transcriptional regulator [Nocardia sp. NPDC059091]|uniref:TetR/AcrR family transcriptional regulator n=1 Tax=unclassified Nocardia TaxID=2637762 RepID=UPI00367DC531
MRLHVTVVNILYPWNPYPMGQATTSRDRSKPYHHGALRATLIEAGIALAREGGPDRVILREAARAAGVTHSAAYRHFAAREALLAEVAHHARQALAAEMRHQVARTDDPRLRLRAVGTAYVHFALAEPGLFRTAFIAYPPAPELPPPTLPTEECGPFEILGQVLDEAQTAGLLNPIRRPGAEIAAWSAVHGLAGLLLDGPLPATPENIEDSLERVLDATERGLLTL